MTISNDAFNDVVQLIKGLEYKYLSDLASVLNNEIAARRKSAEQEAKLKILKIASDLGVSIEELIGSKPGVYQKKQKVPDHFRRAATPKFRHPTDADITWSGRGLAPKWFKQAVANGATADSLLIAA